MSIRNAPDNLLSITSWVDPVLGRSYKFLTPYQDAEQNFRAAWDKMRQAVGQKPVERIKIRIDVVLETDEEARHGEKTQAR